MSTDSFDNLPLVSIIVPTYNYGHFIEDTLASVAAQTYQNLECIVVDDGSSDDTSERVARFTARDGRFMYIYKQNQGLSAARNTGIENSRGEYVQFLDSDDLIEPDKISRQVCYLEEHPEVDIIYGGVRFFRTEAMEERAYPIGGDQTSWLPEILATDTNTLLVLISRNMPVNTPVIRRRVIEEVGPFDTSFRQLEDWDFWIRCAALGKTFQFKDWDHTLALVRRHPSSMSKNRSEANNQLLLLREKIARQPYPANVLKMNRYHQSIALGNIGIEEVAGGRVARGVFLLAKTGFMNPRPREKVKWLCCAALAAFVPKNQLRCLPGTPITSRLIYEILRHGQIQPSTADAGATFGV